jgi:hypothetical protein
MSSQIDIYNMALGHLGVTTTVASLTEPSKERKAMDRFWDAALEATLRDKDWPFTTKFKNPGLIGEEPTVEWDYSYRYPTDCLTVRRIMPADGRGSAVRIPFRIARDDTARLIYTDQPEAMIEYTARVSDSSQFPPDFTMALSFRLAAYTAPSLTRGDDNDLGGRALKMYILELGLAGANAYNEEQKDPQPDSEFIRERGG